MANFYPKYLDEQTVKILDTIDIEKYVTFDCCIDVPDLMKALEYDYEDTLSENSHFQGYLFNWMDEEEFSDYLIWRYPTWSYYEDVIVIRQFKPRRS